MSDAPPSPTEPQKIIDESESKSAFEKENDEVSAELSQQSKNTKLSMDVLIYSPFRNYYEGNAFSVSAVNQTGPFDILPTHHNFITLLTPCEMIVRNQKGEQKIQISGGIMHVKADRLIVFLDV